MRNAINFSRFLPSRRLALVIALGCVLCLTYLTTFAGLARSNDELWLADTTQSIALHGSYDLNQTQWAKSPPIVSDVEPLQPILAAPLYWIAYHLAWVGNVHALYLFNPLVTALTAIMLFYYALLLDTTERTALVAALLFGLTTIAWPYTRTFFREPVTGLNILAAAYCWERWRRSYVAQGRRLWGWFTLAVVITCLSLLGKEAAFFVLPMFALLAYPGIRALRRSRGEFAVLLSAGVVFALVLILVLLGRTTSSAASESRGGLPSLLSGLLSGLPWVPAGTGGLLISPGRGMLWFSPVLILGLASPALLPRERWRESWLPLVVTVLFAMAYASLRRDQWFGGAGWGARYMVPLAPLLMLTSLPAIERMLGSSRRWPKIALAALAVAGLAVQWVGTYVDTYYYSDYFMQRTGQLPWLGLAIWSVRWSQIVGGLLFLPQSHTDLMWFYQGVDWLTLGLVAAGVIGVGVIVWNLRPGRDSAPREWRIGAALSLPVFVALSAFCLWRSNPDHRYREDTPQIIALRTDLERGVGPHDTVMLSNWHYSNYFMNSYKGQAIWWGLPNSPGERFSPEQPAQVVSDNVDDLMSDRAVEIIDSYLTGGQRYNGQPIWLVGDASPFLTWATRPVEWYLAQTAYFVSAQDYASNARLVKFLPFLSPSSRQAPRVASGARFGDSIRLDGFDLDVFPLTSGPDSLHPGDTLGLSLLWESVGPISTDYTVAVHLISPSLVVYAQQDRQPVEGFAPTGKWKPGDLIRDNFGFILPHDLPAGQYQLWLTIYSWPSLDKLPISGADGAPVGDHLILTRLTVR
jgi:hypothetical protein